MDKLNRLVIASNNEGKIAEIKEILKPYVKEIISLREAGLSVEPEETGKTFCENALIKAEAVYRAAGGVPVIADDSGLEVDYLGGAPGVYSARYAGHGGDAANNAKLLDALRGVPDGGRTARFVCSIVLYIDPQRVVRAERVTEGRILREAAGTNGFGYDPVFYSFDLDAPFGLAAAADKNAVSHRGRALRDMARQFGRG